jgi:hypothetical protein
MRVLSILVICGLMALPSTLYSSTIMQPVNKTINPPGAVYEKLASLKIKEIQKIIGRKLTFKEKISLFILKHTGHKRAQSKQGNTALIFGICGLALLVLGAFFPYAIVASLISAIVAIVVGSSAKKQDSTDKKARSAVLLGWITLGAFVVIAILLLVAIATLV